MNQLIKGLFILPVKLYQWVLRPILHVFFGPSCRHTPSCSNYMIQAIQEWGPIKGIWLGLKRLSTCHPWGGQGHDPVPKRSSK